MLAHPRKNRVRVQKSEKSQFSLDALTVTSDAEKNEGEGAQRESTWSKVQRNKAFFQAAPLSNYLKIKKPTPRRSKEEIKRRRSRSQWR